MKKILFATTALVATAGAASAEIALTGMAEIGILGGDAYLTTQFHTDIDVTFTMTGEADNGLTFGAKVDLDENGAFGNTTQGGETYFVAYGGARLDMGDVDGAFDAALTEVNVAAGSIADDETAHWGFDGNAGLDGFYDGQIATFSYTASGFTGYLSAEIDDLGIDDPVWGVGFKYSGDLGGATVGVGLGYQQTSVGANPFGSWFHTTSDGTVFFTTLADDISIMGASVNVALDNGFSAAVNYSELDSDNNVDMTHWAIGLGYTQNALSIGVNYGEDDYSNGHEEHGYGLAVAYDLGGGLAAQFGYGKSESTSIANVKTETDSYSLGLAMSF